MATLCVVADTHRKHRQVVIPPCDVLIHGGDFGCFQQDDARNLEDVDEWFAEAPAKQVICIGGNHDFMLQSREFRFAHARLLEDSSVEVCGLRIYGAPWCPDLAGFAYYATEDELREKWSRIPTGIDVLITHTPPHGILDLPTAGNRHFGCPHLRRELERIRPRVHVFGHIHASHGQVQHSGTTFVNAAVVSSSPPQVCHPATVIELEAA